MLWGHILVSFGALFGDIYRIGEKLVFADGAIQNERFSMQERHGKEFKIRVIFDMRFGSDF